MRDFPSSLQSSRKGRKLESGAQDSSRTRELQPRARVIRIAIAKYAHTSRFRSGGKFERRGEFWVGMYSTVVGAQHTLIDVHALPTFPRIATDAVARVASDDGSADS